MTFDDVLAGVALIAILRGIEPAQSAVIGEAAHGAGFVSVEVPLNSPAALGSIAALRARFDGRMLIGAGTVLCAGGVRAAASAGATFIVSPNADPNVIEETKTAGLVSVPGIFTPTEAFAALAAGADALKLFPAEAASPAILKALLAVLPSKTNVLPVGGIDAAAIGPWRAAGAAGFGVGGAIYRPGRSPGEVASRARALVAAWRRERPT